MITIICATNRENSYSSKMAGLVADVLDKHNTRSQLLGMRDLPADFPLRKIDGDNYPEFDVIAEKYIGNVDKFIFVIPEYNGSFPGIIKTFIDSVPTRYFHDKKASLIGISSGRSGALRALDDMTGILHYLRVEVLSDKPKFPQIEKIMTDLPSLSDEEATGRLERHVERFLRF